MVTIVTTGNIAYNDETVYAVRVVNTTSRRFGHEIGNMVLPREKRTSIDRLVSSSFDANSKSYGDVAVEFPVEYALVDAKELSYIDDVLNTPSGPPYVWIITAVEPSGAFTLPSRTVHIELAGITKQVDIAGCLLKSQNINYAIADPAGVRMKDTFLGQRVISGDNLVSNLFGQTSGTTEDMEFSIGNNAASTVLKATGQSGGSKPNVIGTPSLRTAYANDTQPFIVDKGTSNQIVIGGAGNLTTGAVVGGTDLTTALSGFGININHEFEESRPNRAGTNNYNKTIQPYLHGAFIKNRTFTCALVLDPTSDVLARFEDPQLEEQSNEIYIKVQKADDSADWIAFMFTSSGTQYNPQEDYQANYGYIDETQFHTIGWKPQKMQIVASNANAALRSIA